MEKNARVAPRAPRLIKALVRKRQCVGGLIYLISTETLWNSGVESNHEPSARIDDRAVALTAVSLSLCYERGMNCAVTAFAHFRIFPPYPPPSSLFFSPVQRARVTFARPVTPRLTTGERFFSRAIRGIALNYKVLYSFKAPDEKF